MNDILRERLESSWQNDIITVVAAGNEGRPLDRVTPQKLGTAENALITVGGVNNKGVLDSITNFNAGRGGSLTVYALSDGVRGAKWDSTTELRIDGGTSLACPAVAGLAAYFASLPSLAGEWTPGSVSGAMKAYITRYAYRRTPNPIPDDLPSSYTSVPPADSIIVAYNRAPEGLCSAKAAAKRNVVKDKRPDIGVRQESGDFDVVISGAVVATILCQSYCAVSSTLLTSPSTIPKPASTSDFVTLTGLPTLSSASYCTEVLSNGRELLHTKTGSVCTYNTAEPTSSTEAPPAPTRYVNEGILTCGTRTDQGSAEHWFTRGDAWHARNTFCANMTQNDPPIVLEPGSHVNMLGTYVALDNVDYPISLSAKWGALDDSECPTLNLGTNDDAGSLCSERIATIISNCKLVYSVLPSSTLICW